MTHFSFKINYLEKEHGKLLLGHGTVQFFHSYLELFCCIYFLILSSRNDLAHGQIYLVQFIAEVLLHGGVQRKIRVSLDYKFTVISVFGWGWLAGLASHFSWTLFI